MFAHMQNVCICASRACCGVHVRTYVYANAHVGVGMHDTHVFNIQQSMRKREYVSLHV